jgi:hypothetical protein
MARAKRLGPSGIQGGNVAKGAKTPDGAFGSEFVPPASPNVTYKHQSPEVTINGTVYQWEPGHEDGIPEEALVIWRRYLEANQ